MVTQTDAFMMGDNVSHSENVQHTENINLSSIEDVDKTMVNEGRERLLSAIYGSFEARIPLEGEAIEYMEENSPTVSDLYHRSGMCSPRLDEAWSSDREDTRSIRSGRGHSKKLSTTSNISVDSGVAYDEGIVQINIPPPSRDEPKFPPEPTKTIISFMFCFSSWVLTTVTLALVHERVPDRLNTSRLPDSFLDNVPESPWALDVSEVILVFSGLSCAVLVCFHKYRLILIRRIFFLLGVLYLFRCLTMYVTVLPVASKTYYCSPKAGDAKLWDVILRAVRLLIGMGLSVNGLHTYCGDYIYSGHTVILTMACLIFQEYTPRRCWLLHWIAVVVPVCGVTFLMIAHGHYSVDVILAYYITTRLFWIYHTLANNSILKKKGPSNYFSRIWWWPIFYYFEKNINGPIPRRYEWPLPWPQRCSAKLRDRDS